MFRTELSLKPSAVAIDHSKSLLTIGSCFAEVMGERFTRNKFTASVSPFGTIYNPFSIFKLLYKVARGEALSREGIVKSQGVYQHYDLHSRFGHTSEKELWQHINNKCEEVRRLLPATEWVIITLGTALVYYLREANPSGGRIVANCHKVPAQRFEKRLLTVDEMLRTFRLAYDALKEQNPGIKFIMTVSPVRHTRETLEVNSHSKALLRVAAGEIASKFLDVHYFPAYEIMLDDLRDYRFYEKDMIHPNETAHDYIWDKFSSAYFTESTAALNEHWSKLRRNLEHKAFLPHSEQHQDFLKKTMAEMEQLSSRLDLQQEIQQLKQQIL